MPARRITHGKRITALAKGMIAPILLSVPLFAHAQLSLPQDNGNNGGASVRLPGAGAATSSDNAAASARADESNRHGGFQPIDRVVAVVNQGVITESELNAQIQLFESRMAANQGGALPPRAELRRQVLDQLITQLAQEQFAQDYGLKPSQSEIDRAAAEVALNNGMSPSQLSERLKSEGVSYESFRRQLTAEIITMRLRERETANSVNISEAEIDAELAKSGKISDPEYDVRQILVKVPEGASEAEIAQLQKKAEDLAERARKGEDFGTLAKEYSEASDAANGGQLGWRTASRMPGLFVDTVKSLQVGGISAPVRSPVGFHVLKLQERRAGEAATVQLTHARHILLPAETADAEVEAQRRLELYRRDIEAGKGDFAKLAREFSTDPGSAAKGGDLGWLYPGDTVPEFEQAMNALADGEISEPVRSPFGIHLIQVLERRTDQESPERLRNTTRQKLRASKGAEAYEQWVRELRDRTYVEYRLDDADTGSGS